MTQTQDSKHFSDNQWLEITAKLQKPNAPSKQAIPCEYCVSESAIRKKWGQGDSIFNFTDFVPESTRVSTFCVSQAHFPKLEDQLFL